MSATPGTPSKADTPMHNQLNPNVTPVNAPEKFTAIKPPNPIKAERHHPRNILHLIHSTIERVRDKQFLLFVPSLKENGTAHEAIPAHIYTLL